MWRALPLVLLMACGNKNNQPTPTEEPVPTEDGAAEGGTATDGGDAAATDAGAEEGDAGVEPKAEPTPESLYAECKERMENPQAEGECTTDADCATGGCGGEVCSTPEGLKDLMFTCVDKPCFHVGDACGCHEGQCTWTLKTELPPIGSLPPAPLPPNRLPPSPPPTEDGGDKGADGGAAPAEEKAEGGAE